MRVDGENDRAKGWGPDLATGTGPFLVLDSGLLPLDALFVNFELFAFDEF